MEKVGLKIREAELQKVPYAIVIGDKEMKKGTLSIRKRKEGNIGELEIQEVMEKFKEDVKNRC